MLVAVYNKPNGGISVTYFGKSLSQSEIEQYMQEIGTPFSHIIEESQIPNDEIGRLFFDALHLSDGVFSYNLPAARKIRIDSLRAMRKDLFPLVDNMRAKAVETGVGMENVARLANKMRSMPADALADLENLGDVQSIASYLPSVFGELVAAQ